MQKITLISDYVNIANEYGELSKASKQMLSSTKHAMAVDEKMQELQLKMHEFEEGFIERFHLYHLLSGAGVLFKFDRIGRILIKNQN